MDIEDMNETLIVNRNNVVGADDIVFHFGDFCLGDSAKLNRLLDKFNGKIYQILGNHDLRNFRKSYAEKFEPVAMLIHIYVDNQKICLNYYSFICYDGSYDGVWQLFGHVYTNWNNTGDDAARLKMLFLTQYYVGIDNNNFTPVSYTQVREVIGKQIGQSKKGGYGLP